MRECVDFALYMFYSFTPSLLCNFLIFYLFIVVFVDCTHTQKMIPHLLFISCVRSFLTEDHECDFFL